MKTPMQELIEWLDSIISVLPDSAVGAKNQMIVAKGKAESMLEKEKEVMCGIQWNKYPETKPPQMQTRVLMVNFDRIWREGMARDGRLFTYNSSAGVWVRTTATHWAHINLPNQ